MRRLITVIGLSFGCFLINLSNVYSDTLGPEVAESILNEIRNNLAIVHKGPITVTVGNGTGALLPGDTIDPLPRGTVKLQGRVNSEESKSLAADIALRKPGVTSVINDLVIDTSLTSGSISVSGTSPELVREALARINKEMPQSGQYEIKVQSIGEGNLTLLGKVSSDAMKNRAEAIAREISGVTSISNKIIAPLPVSDDEISGKVMNALKEEGIDTSSLVIESRNGIVTLSGDRSTHEDIDKLITTTIMVDGVKSVNSKMTLNGRSYTDRK